jgi:acyl-CoA thioesterase-1
MRAWLLGLSLLVSVPSGAAQPLVLLVGDSIGATFGVPLSQGWPVLLEQRLHRAGHAYRVVNASVTGDTTRGGLARLPAALERHTPSIVIIELGGNDGLRGISTQEMRQNLEKMIDLARDAGARVLLVGMRLPPNYGKAFTERFHRVYHQVADALGVALVPFFLEGVGTDRGLMQPDGIHPNEQAQPQLLDNLWPYLEPLLDGPGQGSRGGAGSDSGAARGADSRRWLSSSIARAHRLAADTGDRGW